MNILISVLPFKCQNEKYAEYLYATIWHFRIFIYKGIVSKKIFHASVKYIHIYYFKRAKCVVFTCT